MFDINDASVYDDNYTLLSKIRKILKSLSNLTDRVTALENGGGGGGGSVGDFQNKLYGQERKQQMPYMRGCSGLCRLISRWRGFLYGMWRSFQTAELIKISTKK